MKVFEKEFFNNKNEKVIIVISNCEHDRNSKHDLMRLWVKAGYMDHFIDDNLFVETYVYDDTGCWGRYNPQIMHDDAHKIDFEWILENTKENIKKLVAEVERLANM